MQNRYTGDIGDYVKYSLLRSLSDNERLGVAWYLFPCEDHNDDGKHVAYLNQPERWKELDPELFDRLKKIVSNGTRTVKAIEESGVLPGALFSSGLLESDKDSAKWRTLWFDGVLNELYDCNIVFADPDNGLCLDEKFKASRTKDWKRIPVSEVLELAENRTAIIYHHNSRFKGGHFEEIKYWMEILPGCTSAFYFKRFNNRTFFILNATPDVNLKLQNFAETWREHGELINSEYHLTTL